MIFIGSPGTGKTTAARIMAGFLYKNGFIKENKCLETDGNFLKAATAADTAAKTELVLREAMGGVLFIDEAYTLAMDAAGEAATATLMKRMEDDRGKVVIILAGYTNFRIIRIRNCARYSGSWRAGKGYVCPPGRWNSFPCGSHRKRSCHISGMPGQYGKSLRKPWICMRSTCRMGHSRHRNVSSCPQPTSQLNQIRACSMDWGSEE